MPEPEEGNGSAHTRAWVDQVDHLRDAVTSWTGNPCHVYEIDERGLAVHVAEREPIVVEWRRDVIPLAGADIRLLLR